jgi:hypothetical protein
LEIRIEISIWWPSLTYWHEMEIYTVGRYVGCQIASVASLVLYFFRKMSFCLFHIKSYNFWMKYWGTAISRAEYQSLGRPSNCIWNFLSTNWYWLTSTRARLWSPALGLVLARKSPPSAGVLGTPSLCFFHRVPGGEATRAGEDFGWLRLHPTPDPIPWCISFRTNSPPISFRFSSELLDQRECLKLVISLWQLKRTFHDFLFYS